ncbi:hypothetical protein D3C76_1721500 [compost metagenome]
MLASLRRKAKDIEESLTIRIMLAVSHTKITLIELLMLNVFKDRIHGCCPPFFHGVQDFVGVVGRNTFPMPCR